MRPFGISTSALARDLDVPANRISEIVAGRRTISADTALRFGAYFGLPAQFWMNLQNEYDLRTARADGLDQIRPYKAA